MVPDGIRVILDGSREVMGGFSVILGGSRSTRLVLDELVLGCSNIKHCDAFKDS